MVGWLVSILAAIGYAGLKRRSWSLWWVIAGAKEGRKTLQAFASRFNPGGLSGGAEARRLLDQLDALKCDPS